MSGRKTKCPECGERAYITGWGCTACGEGNPYKRIRCLTPAVMNGAARQSSPADREGE